MILPSNIAEAADLWLVGPLAAAPLPQTLVARGMPQIAIDGGIHAAARACLWLGDGDSSVAPLDIAAFFKPTQDMTDLEFTLEVLRAAAWRRLHLSGFTGGRSDHFLGNIGAVDAEMRRRAAFEQAVFYGAAGQVVQRHLAAGAQSFRHEGVFSIFALTQGTVSLSGACDYPAHRIALAPLSGRGVSNIAAGDVRIESDVPVIVIFDQD